MKIVIDNIEFPFNEGCKVLKLKHGDKVPFPELEDFWGDVVGMTFSEIAQTFVNMEQRRVAIKYLGMENLVSQVQPKLLSKETIRKTTTWVNQEGELETFDFDDTYELYQVSGELLSEGLNGTHWQKLDDVHYVKFKDTSTDREYLLWVNAYEVCRTNGKTNWFASNENYGKLINPIQAIAWSIQTNIEEQDIEQIVRQGDCIMIKKKPNAKPMSEARHLTEKEYRNLLKLRAKNITGIPFAIMVFPLYLCNMKKNTTETTQRMSFNEWTKMTQFGILWAPDIDEMRFYQDHELRKEVYQDVKHLPKMDFEEKPFIEHIVQWFIRLLKLEQ